MDHNHSHNHSHSHSNLKGKKLLFTILLNILITVAQVIGGIVSGSLSLLSDALHNFSDVISLVISYIADIFSKKKASLKRTFGYKRAEIMAAFINSSTLIIVGFILIFEAIERFYNPQEIESGLVIWLALLAIVANGLSVLLLRKDSKENMNMRSAYVHLFSDMAASIAVLIGGLLMKYYQMFWVDSVLTILIAIYLLYVGYDLFKSSFKILMLFTPDSIQIEKVNERLSQISEVKNVHHIHIWELNEFEIHMEAHIDFNKDLSLSEFNILLKQIEEILYHDFGINHVNLQPEYLLDDSKEMVVQD